MAEHAAAAVTVHAAVLVWRNRGILVVDDARAGTPGLVEALVRTGATACGDGPAVLDEDGRVRPTRPSAAAQPSAPEASIEPGVLLIANQAPHTVWAPDVLEGARAMLPLLEHIPALRGEPARALERTARFGPGLVTLRGAYGDADQAASAVLEFVDRLVDGLRPSAALGGAPRPAVDRARPRDVLADPAWVPVAVAPKKNVVRFRRFARPFYIAHAGTNPRPWDVELPLTLVESASTTVPDPDRVLYIYHHGYAGSTLLFRLLDCAGTCLAYDEPNVHLRWYGHRAVRNLCYRTFRAGEVPLIKTVPVESRNAQRHFADHANAKGLFLYAPLEEYVAATLRYQYRRDYVTRMARTLGGPVHADAGDAAVYCWNVIAGEVRSVAAHHALKTLDATAFFLEPAPCLRRIWEWFGLPPREDWPAVLATVAGSHSKNRGPFTASDRLEQKEHYAANARAWLDGHAPEVAAARDACAALARFSL